MQSAILLSRLNKVLLRNHIFCDSIETIKEQKTQNAHEELPIRKFDIFKALRKSLVEKAAIYETNVFNTD